MIHEYQLRILPEQAASEQSLKQYIGREKGLDVRTINAIRILKRSIDARQRTIYVNLTIRVFVNETPSEEEFVRTDYPNVEGRPAVIVVGAGPGGLFAALKLIELGLRPIVVERGKNVRERKEDLARISREHKVDAESNYSFGEGGAGAYSDGKLYTRSKKRGSVEKILNVFCQHGASPTILSDAHPHIGTDKLPRVIENMRNTILACGGEVHFQTRMESILIEGQKVKGIETNTGKTFLGPVILATGHSARDVYRWLYAHGVQLETKGIAIGVRLEHPSMLIDQIQYHNKNGRGKYLPAAEYSFVQQVDGRGVYSFCMCPGGFVVPAASGPHQLVVNGMSPSNRGTKWSNSGMVVELGKNVRERKEDLARISREHKVNAESNYSFGEGGAGAYSDGKLYTRSKKRGSVEKILNVFCQHGASPTILSDAHPHIGTDKLPRVIENMRNTILACGGEVHFQTRMEAILIEGQKVKGIETNTGKTFLGPVILATGHSARDVYRWLYAHGVQLETKGIAIGVRLEHPSMLIDQIQYHNKNGRGKYLPAAEYSFVQQVDGRGVYSFCMCPGGFVVPAASGPHQLVVNGMSPSNRSTKWSNSGMVVETRPEDLLLPEMQLQAEPFPESNESLTEELILRDGKQPEGTIHTLAMMRFQEKLEQICWQQGNMRQTAPSQRMVDFTRKKLSYDLPATSYSPGLVSSPLHFWMPSFLSERLSKGFQLFGKSSRGFLTNEAVMIAVETRTSSPVRIVRDKDTLQHLTMEGLFPCGEGAGYAGGIVSAGIDGERCAEAVANYLNH